MILVSKMYLAMLDRESSIFIHMLLLFCSVLNFLIIFICFLLFIMHFSPKISFDKAGILNNSFLNHIAFLIKLMLQRIPYFFFFPCLFQTISNFPDSAKIWNCFRKIQKITERKPIISLKFHLFIGKTIP